MIGSTIGHYNITSKLGQGGMGVVYRATDAKLDREVALKLLPESFAQNSERLARFDREAKILANLNHSNIAGIYGIEQFGESRSLILELVEGEDLSEVIKRGSLSVSETLEIGIQIADAMDAAHEKGIFHRDLKPGNIKISEGNTVKVLDFGLAKGATESSDISATDTVNPEDSPTITDEFTKPGTILGTAAYMSPEQARGKKTDKLSDIWSFGAILFECLTGKKAFQGEDATETLARIVQGSPDWSTLPPFTPPALRFLLEKCLTRHRKNRLRDMADARLDLEKIMECLKSETASNLKDSQNPSLGYSLIWAGALLLVGLVLGGLLITFFPTSKSTQEIVKPKHAQLLIDRDVALLRVYYPGFTLSPQGYHISYNLQDAYGGLLYLRSLIDGDDVEIPNTKGGFNQFFSPDGRYIGFSTINGLKKVPISGGPSIMIAKGFSVELGASWGVKDQIVGAGQSMNLHIVPGSGGEPVSLTTLEDGELRHMWPQFLPDGEHIIFMVISEQKKSETNELMGGLAVTDITTGKHQMIDPTEQYIYPRYSPIGEHILYASGNHLFARPFDVNSLNFTGEPVLIQENVETSGIGAAYFDVNPEGTLAYLNGLDTSSEMTLAWFSGSGVEERATQHAGRWKHMNLSPDGTIVTLVGGGDIWLIRFRGDQLRQLTHGYSSNDITQWSHDGAWVYFSTRENGLSRIWRIKSDNSMKQPEFLFESDKYLMISSVSKNLQTIYLTGNFDNGRNAWKLDLTVDPPVLSSLIPKISKTAHPKISPNGDWLAYVSGQTGRRQVNVQHVDGGAFEIVSTDGGSYPRWSADGKRLLYYNTVTPISIMSVSVGGDTTAIELSEHKRVCILPPDVFATAWDASQDGDRILALTSAESIDAAVQTDMTASTISIIFNWAQDFKRKGVKELR